MSFYKEIFRLLVLIALFAVPKSAFSAVEPVPLGIQLFTLRDMLPKDVKGTLAKVAKAGFSQVEVFGFSIKDQFWGLTPRELKQILDENHLTAISGHFNMFPYLKNGDPAELKAAIEAAKILGLRYLTIPWLTPDLRGSAKDYFLLAEKLNYAGKLCKQAGIKLAYHNHDFEFEKHDRHTGMDILLKNTNKKLVDFEMDIYWVIRSGIDPVTLFKANPGRFVMWHIKDMDKNDPKLNTEIGKGSIDYKKIYANRKLSGAKYFFLEHETNYNPDPIGSITTSAQNLRTSIFR